MLSKRRSHPASLRGVTNVPISGYTLSEVIASGESLTLSEETLLRIERGDKHEIQNKGKRPLRTLNIYVPPAYTKDGDELPAAGP
jgi:mannose-6-phosphate isomerase-like protein (cupin superfamily)